MPLHSLPIQFNPSKSSLFTSLLLLLGFQLLVPVDATAGRVVGGEGDGMQEASGARGASVGIRVKRATRWESDTLVDKLLQIVAKICPERDNQNDAKWLWGDGNGRAIGQLTSTTVAVVDHNQVATRLTYQNCDDNQGDVHCVALKECRSVCDIQPRLGQPFTHADDRMLLQLNQVQLELNAAPLLKFNWPS